MEKVLEAGRSCIQGVGGIFKKADARQDWMQPTTRATDRIKSKEVEVKQCPYYFKCYVVGILQKTFFGEGQTSELASDECPAEQ